MKTFIISLLVITCMISTPLQAAQSCSEPIKVKVTGLVCDFCARALEKVFGKRDEVSGIKVDLDSGLVTIATKSGQVMDDATITRLITDAGYNVTSIDKGC